MPTSSCVRSRFALTLIPIPSPPWSIFRWFWSSLAEAITNELGKQPTTIHATRLNRISLQISKRWWNQRMKGPQKFPQSFIFSNWFPNSLRREFNCFFQLNHPSRKWILIKDEYFNWALQEGAPIYLSGVASATSRCAKTAIQSAVFLQTVDLVGPIGLLSGTCIRLTFILREELGLISWLWFFLLSSSNHGPTKMFEIS